RAPPGGATRGPASSRTAPRRRGAPRARRGPARGAVSFGSRPLEVVDVRVERRGLLGLYASDTAGRITGRRQGRRDRGDALGQAERLEPRQDLVAPLGVDLRPPLLDERLERGLVASRLDPLELGEELARRAPPRVGILDHEEGLSATDLHL